MSSNEGKKAKFSNGNVQTKLCLHCILSSFLTLLDCSSYKGANYITLHLELKNSVNYLRSAHTFFRSTVTQKNVVIALIVVDNASDYYLWLD